MPCGCCEFVDSRLRRCPPDRASAVPYGQAGENALRFPHLAHRSAAVHKLHRATATSRIEFDSGKGETFNRQPALACSSRNLSKRPRPPHPHFCMAAIPVSLKRSSQPHVITTLCDINSARHRRFIKTRGHLAISPAAD